MADRTLSVKESTLVEIADAIRTKTSETSLVWLTEFAEKILSISGGGIDYAHAGDFAVPSDTVEPLTITHGYADYPSIIFVYASTNTAYLRGSTIGGICTFPSSTMTTGKNGLAIGIRATGVIQDSTAYRNIDCITPTTFEFQRCREDAMMIRKDYVYHWIAFPPLVLAQTFSLMPDGLVDQTEER